MSITHFDASAAVSRQSRPRIAIVGGGLAGLAAAAGLAGRGLHVELLEARRKLGGRAGSYVDRATGQEIDHCQHVAMGCCTNFLDFCRRTEIEELLERHRRLTFFGPNAERSEFRSSRCLPPPLHLAAALLGLKHLTFRDKRQIARAMLALIRTPPTDAADGPTVLAWLRERGQSEQAIERFWQVILVSALGESLDRASLPAARKVFLDGFLAHRDAWHVLVPRAPLSELYDRRVADWLRGQEVAIRLETPVETIEENAGPVVGVQTAAGSESCDFVILAVPWQRVSELLPDSLRADIDPANQFALIPAAPITSVHLWFDRPLTELPHAVLVGRLSQWVFARQTSESPGEHYYQVVISASHDLGRSRRPGGTSVLQNDVELPGQIPPGRRDLHDRQAIIETVRADLAAVFPAAKDAKLLRWQLITDHDAVFSVRPGLDALRPPQKTPSPNLMLAGDWTRTGWPATMESAVRSGYLAAEAVLASLGQPHKLLVPDLPPGRLMRWLGACT